MKKLLIVLGAGLVLLLSACGMGEVAGPVVDKEYRAAYDEQYQDPQYTYICVPTTVVDPYTGRATPSQKCDYVYTHSVTKTRHIQDRWSLQVHDEETDKKKWVTVTETIYDRTELGDFYSNKKDADSDGHF